jgi:hypothetical protein
MRKRQEMYREKLKSWDRRKRIGYGGGREGRNKK